MAVWLYDVSVHCSMIWLIGYDMCCRMYEGHCGLRHVESVLKLRQDLLYSHYSQQTEPNTSNAQQKLLTKSQSVQAFDI